MERVKQAFMAGGERGTKKGKENLPSEEAATVMGDYTRALIS